MMHQHDAHEHDGIPDGNHSAIGTEPLGQVPSGDPASTPADDSFHHLPMIPKRP
jgi:hypothetical protein